MATTPYNPRRGQWRDLICSPEGPADSGAKLVAVCLEKYVSNESLKAFPSPVTIAADSGLHEKTVRRHLVALIGDGFLCAERKFKGRANELREFELKFPARPRSDLSHGQTERSASTAEHPVSTAERIVPTAEQFVLDRGANCSPNLLSEPLASTSIKPLRGRSDLKNLMSRKPSGEKLSDAQLEERRQQMLDACRARGVNV
jgi:hypothetical protein